MNVRTTLVLLALAAALVAGWAIFLRGGPDPFRTGRGPLFSDLVAGDVVSIRIEDGTGDRLPKPVMLRRAGDGSWTLATEAIDGGEPVRARRETAESILDALRALTPLAALQDSAAEGELAGFGLDPGRRAVVAVERRGRGMLVAEFGAQHGAGQVVFRKGGDPTIWAVAREIRNSAVPAFDSLEDAALLDIPFLDVQRMLFEAPGRPALELERRFDRWWCLRPVQVLADDRKADEIRNSLIDLKVLKRLRGPAAAPDLVPDPPGWRITFTVRGRPEPVVLAIGVETENGLAARVSGGSGIQLVHPGILPVLDSVTGASLRDPHLVVVPRTEIMAVRVRRRGVPAIDVRRVGRAFEMHFPDRGSGPVPPRETDAVAMGTFLDRVCSLEYTGWTPEAVVFPPVLALEVESASGAGTPSRKLVVEFGAEVSDGKIPARIVGEEGSGAVDSASTAFLDDPYWSLLARINRGTNAFFRLARIEITDAAGKSVEVRCRIDATTADLRGSIGQGAAARDVPDNQLHPVKNKLVDFTVKGFVGEDATPEMGLGTPHLKVRWLEAEDATLTSIPAEPRGAWRQLVVGPRQPDGTHFAQMDDALGLVFLLTQEDLTSFFDLLAFAHK